MGRPRRLLIAPALALTLAAVGAAPAPSVAPMRPMPTASPRLTVNFDGDWRFFKGEPPAAPSTQPANGNYPPIDPPSHAFKDESWQTVTLPHDWAIEGPFDEHAPSAAAGAFLPTGVSWYRKTFTVPGGAGGAGAKGKKVFVEFDGIMANADVYINKGHLGHRPNGYVSQRYDLTDYLDYDGPNVIAVRTDTSRQPASRWYAGAGIYRHARLVVENPVHMAWGNGGGSPFVATEKVMEDGRASVRVRATVVNESDRPQTVGVSFGVRAPGAGGAASYGSPVTKELAAGAAAEVELGLVIDRPQLWSLETPALYELTTAVTVGGARVDEETTPFGIRTAEFKADTGFWLNGKNLKLKGVCLHHEVGALGAAVPLSAWESRLTELKKYGVNAIRVAHAPMAPEFYGLCDRLGLLVMDEVFDVWTVGKESADYHLYFKDWWQRDLEAVMTAHRNHPSIVLWSLGNEIWDILPQNPDPALDQFVGPKRPIDVARNLFVPMREVAHRIDPTRPVTIAQMRPNVNNTYANGFADLMDVVGQNYRDNELLAAHRQKPERKIIGTESYKTRDTWLAMRDNPAYSGQFLWAGVDYMGEAGAWPNVVSPSGLLDRTNWPRGEALEREAWWSDKPVLHLARMVTMPTRPGRPPVVMGYANWTPAGGADGAKPETVSAYSNCDEVELFLNGQSLGTKPKDPKDAPRQWQVPFAAGTLRAVAKNGGQVVASDELKTAAAPAKVVLKAERSTLKNDPEDVVYVRAFVTDADGTTNPNATHKLTFAVTGPGKLVATDNGDVKSHEPFRGAERSAFEGTCVAIVRATADAGQVTVTATADGLSAGTVTLQAAPRP
jgi:beta-galactosidase